MDILFSFTGFHDPYSKGLIGQEEQPGPILSLLSTRAFDLIYLFDTPSTHKITEEMKKAISSLHRNTEVVILEINLGREQNFKDPRYTAPYKVKELLTTEISSAFPSIKPVIHVHGFKTSRIFHDRTLDFQVVDNEGCTVTHRFDLTGGIDFLMDKNAPTKIYRYQIEK